MNNTYSEEVKIQLTLDKNVCKDKKDSIDYLYNNITNNLSDGSVLKIKYNFSIDYIGEINKQFETLLDICENPDVVIDIDADFLHSELLLEKLLIWFEEADLYEKTFNKETLELVNSI